MFGYVLHGKGDVTSGRLFLHHAACDVAESGNTTRVRESGKP